MVSREVVLQTVRRMYSSGVDDATVKSTLRDIGMGDDEISSVIAEAKGQKVAPKAREEARRPAAKPGAAPSFAPEEEEGGLEGFLAEEEAGKPQPEGIAEKTAAKVKEHLAEAGEEQALRETTMHATLAAQAEKLEQIGRSVEVMKASAASAGSPLAGQIASLEGRLKSTQKDVEEIKAAASALQSLLQKILETDRQVLAKIGGARK